MARTAIVFGLLLCGLTLYGLVATMIKSPLQFVPLMFGIPILFCGIVGLNPHRRRIALPVAALLALAGTLVGGVATMRACLAWSEGDDFKPLLLALGSLMTLLCLVFVIVFTASLVQQRRRKSLVPRRTTGQRLAEESR